MLSSSWPSAWPPCLRPPSKRQNPWAPDSLRLPQSPGPCAHFLFFCPMYFAWNFADSLTVLQTVPGGHCLCFLRPVFAFGICCSLYLACCSPREPGKLPTIFSRGSPEVTACGGQCWGSASQLSRAEALSLCFPVVLQLQRLFQTTVVYLPGCLSSRAVIVYVLIFFLMWSWPRESA